MIGIIVILAVLFLIVLAIGSYFLFFRGPYPSKISGFPLLSINDEDALKYSECFDILENKEVCVAGIGSVTYGNNAERNDVVRMEITLGADSYKTYLKSLCDTPLYSCENDIVVDGKTYETQKMIYWFYEDTKYIEVKQWGDSMRILESPVVKYFLKKYPPIQI